MLNACIRCSSFFVGLISLIQALVWAGGSIWGIAIYDCTTSFPFQSKPTENFHASASTYLFYVSYLRGSCANKEFNYVAPSAEKSYNFMLTYSIISSIWVPTSVMLIAGTCLGARGVKAKWIYIPWILVTAACCILDVIATIFYAVDISKTLTTEEYIEFMSFPNNEVKQKLGFDVTSSLSGITVIPAVVMTIFASRSVFLWVVNFFFLLFGLQGICAFYKKKPPKVTQSYDQYVKDLNRQNEIEHKEFKKPDNAMANHKNYPVQSLENHRFQEDQGRINTAFLIDEPLRLSPVEVEVKQEKSNPVRYAEVNDLEMESTPEDLRQNTPEVVRFDEEETPEDPSSKFNSKLDRLKKLGLIIPVAYPNDENDERIDDINEVRGVAVSPGSAPASVGESALEAEEYEEIISTPAPAAPSPANSEQPRRVYDVFGNPTEERLTPKVKRIQKIIEAQIQSQKDANGFNTRPFSYHQPLQPMVDSVPKKNDTIRGIEKPPIPVPDYSVRVAKKPSFRSPLPNSATN